MPKHAPIWKPVCFHYHLSCLPDSISACNLQARKVGVGRAVSQTGYMLTCNWRPRFAKRISYDIMHDWASACAPPGRGAYFRIMKHVISPSLSLAFRASAGNKTQASTEMGSGSCASAICHSAHIQMPGSCCASCGACFATLVLYPPCSGQKTAMLQLARCVAGHFGLQTADCCRQIYHRVIWLAAVRFQHEHFFAGHLIPERPVLQALRSEITYTYI